jgi:carboxyl-terminal processing protease
MTAEWQGRRYARAAILWLTALMLAGCGGSGGDNVVGAGPPASGGSGWVAGSFLPAATFVGRCVNPRSGTNPDGGAPYNEIQGAAVDENNWLRSWSNDLYLWYKEVVDRDPGLYATPDYFNILKTTATTASGALKDRFHFTYATAEWLALQQSGTEAGYGAVWAVVASLPPRRIVVAYSHPGSPATTANLQRGEEIELIDGVDVVNSNTQAQVDLILAGLYPDQLNESHSFRLLNPNTGARRTVTLRSANVTIDPVQNVTVLPTQTGPVGYIHFTDHLFIAEQQLIDAFTTLDQQDVTDLVLDLRYNGGGLLAIASEVAYMIAGSVPTAGQTFERLVFNDKHTAVNPVTGGPLTPMPFFDTSSSDQPLPTLELPRVYVLTGGTTCSASESIINGLRGVNVQVIQIGSTTCGKPYGFYPEDHCGTTYFSVQFKGVNAAGFGDYTDGFAPDNRASVGGERLTGCSVRDDFSFPLGNPSESRLAAALEHRLGSSCPAPSGSKPSTTKPFNGATGEELDGIATKSPWLTNRILEGP